MIIDSFARHCRWKVVDNTLLFLSRFPLLVRYPLMDGWMSSMTFRFVVALCFSFSATFFIHLVRLHSFRFLPARRYASAGYRDRNVSVRLSVTRRYCVKTKKASGMIFSPSGIPKTLVFWRQISSPNSKGFPPNGSLKQGLVGKIQRFFRFKRLYLENSSRYGQSYY